MSDEYEQGFKDGIAWSKKHTQFIYNVTEDGDKKVFSHVSATMKTPESFVNRGSLYNCGMGEGFITGRTSIWPNEAQIKEYCQKNGIEYRELECIQSTSLRGRITRFFGNKP